MLLAAASSGSTFQMAAHVRNAGRPTPSVATQFNETLQPLRQSEKGRSLKRGHIELDSSEDPDDDRQRNTWPTPGHVDIKVPSSAIHHDRPLACPFYKQAPQQHRQCSRLNLTKPSYVKQHLVRKHPPCIHCSRCYQIFDTNKNFEEHQRKDPPCEKQEKRDLPGMTAEQVEMLKARSNPADDEARQWMAIWRIIFPTKSPPASPYIDLDVPEEVNELREYMAQSIPSRILNFFLESDLGDRKTDLEQKDREAFEKDLANMVLVVVDSWIGMRN